MKSSKHKSAGTPTQNWQSMSENEKGMREKVSNFVYMPRPLTPNPGDERIGRQTNGEKQWLLSLLGL